MRRTIPRNNKKWCLSPYPNGKNFAFTIVSDADSAYSKRLEPLFKLFDEIGLRVTVTAHAFWADYGKEARDRNRKTGIGAGEISPAPLKGVPLEDPDERAFYLDISRRGHEVGLHTPTDISDTRDEVIRAFEFFKNIFGEYPKIYVEHSQMNNEEDQCNKGADPLSEYYCTDVLNRYGAWIWTDDCYGVIDNRDPQYYDLLAANKTPFNKFALKKYGIIKGFTRSGKFKPADADGFLVWYSKNHIDKLERNRGTAIVYNHFDYGWLDLKTIKMRKDIEDRLRYIASKDGWFVPAGVILDRFLAMEKVYISYSDTWVKVINANTYEVKSVTIISKSKKGLVKDGIILKPNDEGEIIIGDLKPNETLAFIIK